MAYIKQSDLIINRDVLERRIEHVQKHSVPLRAPEETRVFKDIPGTKISSDGKANDRKAREERAIEEARQFLDERISEAKKKTLQRLLNFKITD